MPLLFFRVNLQTCCLEMWSGAAARYASPSIQDSATWRGAALTEVSYLDGPFTPLLEIRKRLFRYQSKRDNLIVRLATRAIGREGSTIMELSSILRRTLVGRTTMLETGVVRHVVA